MSQARSRIIPAAIAAAGMLGFGGVSALAAEPTQQELMDQIKALQAKVEQMETRQQHTENAVDTAAVDRTVREVLEDAHSRSQLLAPEGFTAGYDNGKFVIQSADGKFLLNPQIQMQFRYIANFRDGSKNIDQDDVQAGFELRRMKLNFEGNVFGKNTTYKFQWATNRSSGNLVLEEGFVKHLFDADFAGGGFTGFGIKAGQFKDPVYHEEIVSSKRQLAVERSLTNFLIGGNNTKYEQGVLAVWEPEKGVLGLGIRAEAGYIDGGNTSNTNFQDTGGLPSLINMPNAQGGGLARVDVKLCGDWKNYDDLTALKTTDDLLVIGGGVNVTAADNGTAYFHTVDVQWEPAGIKGLHVYGAYLGLYQEFRNTAADVTSNPYHFGLLGQVGYMLNDEWEVFGRYDYTHLDGGPGGAGTLGAATAITNTVHEITVGANWYLKGHNSKITADFSYLPKGCPVDANGLGILPQATDDAQFVLRLQYQLLL